MKNFLFYNQHLEAKNIPLDERSKLLRGEIVSVLASAKRGHLGASFSLIEMLRVLYDDILQYDAKAPFWRDRDRFILSKGHGCLALYVLLAEKRFFPREELGKFCSHEGILGGHPERHKIPGVEASTGSLGHGLPIGVGFALAARMDGLDHKVFVVCGDGESNEGSIWEAAMCAGKHGLSNLIVMIDYNKQQSYGYTDEVQSLEPFSDKWKSFGFATEEVNGHDVEQLRSALQRTPFHSGKPSALICHTVKGKGVKFIEEDLNWHHKSQINQREIERLMEALEGYPSA